MSSEPALHAVLDIPHKRPEEALRQAGALQNAIFNSANFSSIATDETGVIQLFNVGAERMLGYTASEVLNTITPADISDPQEMIARAEALSLELATAITPGFEALVFKASRGIEDIYELTYIRKDGSRFPAIVSVTALRDDQDAIIGYLLIGTDNTARKQVEADQKQLDQRLRDQHKRFEQTLQEKNVELERQNRRVAEANRLKSEFLANMSHELRTPLNGIIGFSELMHEERVGPVSDQHKEFLGDILTSARHLLQLINDVLDLSKVEAGKIEFIPEKINLSVTITEVCETLRTLSAGKSIWIDTFVDPSVDSVTLDPAKLKQILYNYLSNAIKFTPEQGRIKLSATPAGGDYFRIQEEIQQMPRRSYTTDTRQFARIKDVVTHLPAQAQLRGQYDDGHKAPAGPDARPSSQSSRYQGRSFTVDYPNNWQTYGDPQSAMVTIAPSEGIVRDRNGNVSIGYGAIVSYYFPQDDMIQMRPDMDRLRMDTADLVRQMRQANPEMRAAEPQNLKVNGYSALVTTLNSNSPFQGETEIDQLVTVLRPEGLWYLVFISPQSEARDIKPIFDQMLRSVRFSK